ncbi:hypothetical protein KUV47_10075 [Vannielia litorea]|uniref:hypothetical protein n=1 Tax=Vannielia litorea TaxID=1217970 RepID=UPI001C973E0D|nr:hypothetical protein [Vannielia litorea]MBY6153559.1 hypothetical protein [Vannielia litorea]
MTDKTPDQAPDTSLKHMTEAAKRQPGEGSHPATKAALRRPTAHGEARPAQYARIERGHTA